MKPTLETPPPPKEPQQLRHHECSPDGEGGGLGVIIAIIAMIVKIVNIVIIVLILLLDEILHPLGAVSYCNSWYFGGLCKISSINSSSLSGVGESVA